MNRRYAAVATIALLIAASFYLWPARAPDGLAPTEQPVPLPPAPVADVQDDESERAVASIDPLPGMMATSDDRPCIAQLAYALPGEEQLGALGGRSEAGIAAAQVLVESLDPEHRFAAHLLAPLKTAIDGQTGIEVAIAPIPEPDPAVPLQLWLTLNYCQLPAVDFFACGTEPIEQTLLNVDRSNSEAWVMAAVGRYGRGDADGALAAMQQAAAAAETNSYWIETYELVERALLAATDYNFTSRATLAIGTTSRSVTPFQAVLAMCNETYEASDEWSRACASYGALIARQYDTGWGREIGTSLQQAASRRLGYPEAMDQAEIERQSLMRSVRGMALDRMILSDPAYMSRYLAAVRAEGQLAAQDRMIEEELPPLMERLGLGECIEEIL